MRLLNLSFLSLIFNFLSHRHLLSHHWLLGFHQVDSHWLLIDNVVLGGRSESAELRADPNGGLFIIVWRDHFREVLGRRVRNEEIVDIVVVNQGR